VRIRFGGQLGEVEAPGSGAAQVLGGLSVRQNRVGAGLGQDLVEPPDRELRVQHGERGAELEHGQQRGDEFGSARRVDRDEPAAADPVPPQPPGQPVRPRVELSVAHRGVLEHERGRAGFPRRPLFEESMHARHEVEVHEVRLPKAAAPLSAPAA
jgi:hypothetical protein